VFTTPHYKETSMLQNVTQDLKLDSLPQDRDQWQALVKTLMKLQVLLNARNFLIR
jgi:hypothetical protein